MTDRGLFAPEQVERLLRPIKENRVYEAQGQSHVAAWDVSAHLTRMFGFGNWEKEILELTMISCAIGEDIGLANKKGWYVTYLCRMRLRVRDQFGRLVWENDDVATGSAQNQPSLGDAHDLAAKNAVSYALKRCAKDLGDQFGLSLYRKGSPTAVVGMTLIGTTAVADEPAHPVEGEGDALDA